MTRDDLQDFVECYCSGHEEDRIPTYSDENTNGRWRHYSEEEVSDMENLEFKWIMNDDDDDRDAKEILSDLTIGAGTIQKALRQLVR